MALNHMEIPLRSLHLAPAWEQIFEHKLINFHITWHDGCCLHDTPVEEPLSLVMTTERRINKAKQALKTEQSRKQWISFGYLHDRLSYVVASTWATWIIKTFVLVAGEAWKIHPQLLIEVSSSSHSSSAIGKFSKLAFSVDQSPSGTLTNAWASLRSLIFFFFYLIRSDMKKFIKLMFKAHWT